VLSRLVFAFLFVPAIYAQPLIFPRAVVNAASFMPPGLPGGSIALGSVFSIFGARMGPDSSPTLAFPLATTLGGVSITVSSPDGSASVNAIPLFVSAAQINAIMPSNAPLGPASVVVSFNGGRSNRAPVRVVSSQFGIYTIAAGMGPGIFQNFNSATDQPVNALTISAKPGQAITMWGTGLGKVPFADNVAPTPGNLPTPTEVFVGGKAASILYNGRSPCCAGTDQIVFTVPNDAPTGCWVPVQVRTEAKFVSSSATMAISSDGSSCSDSFNAPGQIVAKGGKLASVVLQRSIIHEDNVAFPTDVTADTVVTDVQQENGGPFAFSTIFSLPPQGTCTTYNVVGDIWTPTDKLPFSTPSGRFLNFGAPLTIVGPADRRAPSPTNANRYTWLGEATTGQVTVQPKNGPFLTPGSYSIISGGGADVGGFQVSVTMPAALTWTNRDQLSTIDRSQPLTINVSGAPANAPVVIRGGAVDKATNASAQFVCVAPAGASSFTVPSAILANVPPARARTRFSKGGVFVSSWPYAGAVTFNTAGIDLGVAGTSTLAGRPVKFQ
jgi:uncharacterized protein (TIGR03437 family)